MPGPCLLLLWGLRPGLSVPSQEPPKGNPGSSVAAGRVPGAGRRRGCGRRQKHSRASTQRRERNSYSCKAGSEMRPRCTCRQLRHPREAGADAYAEHEVEGESGPPRFLSFVLFPPIILKYRTLKRAFQSQKGFRKSCLKYLLKT